MSWIGPVVKGVVKYGPHAQKAWELGGRQAQAALVKALENRQACRKALQHAETVRDGAVIALFDQGQASWGVLSGEEPIAAYPATSTPLAEVVAHTDLSKRMTPEEFRQGRRSWLAAERARAVAGRVAQLRPGDRRRDIEQS